MINRNQVEPKWVLVEGILRDVSEFALLKPQHRPPALCPLCKLPVVLKLGTVKVHHYAHVREASCPASLAETALHLNTKFHLYHQLQGARERRLFVEQLCERCHQNTQPHLWTMAWDDVQVEYRLDAARPDIVLLAQGRVLTALEILVTHAVDERKIAYFAAQEIPWLEIPASPELYLEPSAWNTTHPLPVACSSVPYPEWICPECLLHGEQEQPSGEQPRLQEQKRQQDLRPEKIPKKTSQTLSRPSAKEALALALQQAHSDPDARVRAQAVRFAGEFAPYLMLDEVRGFLQDGEEEVRLAAALALTKWGEPQAVRLLLQQMGNEGNTHRLTILRSLTQLCNDPLIQPILRAALADKDERVRQGAAEVLGAKKPIR